MDTDDLLHRHGKQPIGVVVADIRLGGVGDVLDIGQGLDLVRSDTRLGQALVVERHIIHAVLHLMLQFLELEFFDLLSGHGLNVLLKKHGGNSFFP